MEKVKFIVGTRENQENFFQATATGKFLRLYSYLDIEVHLFPKNKQGLPTIYNKVIIESQNDPCLLIFCHDDLYITDYYWLGRIFNCLNNFEVIGLVGNKNRTPLQPSWAFKIDSMDAKNFIIDDIKNFSGMIGHGKSFFPDHINLYGEPCQEVKLLDGVFLACRSQTLKENQIYFDERFDFHFYDMDFCRQLEEKKIKMGTADISAIHESKGNLNDKNWQESMIKYFQKWKE